MGIKDNYILHQMNEEYVIIEVSDGSLEFSHVYYINETGAFIFKLLKQGLGKEDIIQQMAEEYDAPKEKLCSDYEAFLKMLQDKKIYE